MIAWLLACTKYHLACNHKFNETGVAASSTTFLSNQGSGWLYTLMKSNFPFFCILECITIKPVHFWETRIHCNIYCLPSWYIPKMKKINQTISVIMYCESVCQGRLLYTKIVMLWLRLVMLLISKWCWIAVATEVVFMSTQITHEIVCSEGLVGECSCSECTNCRQMAKCLDSTTNHLQGPPCQYIVCPYSMMIVWGWHAPLSYSLQRSQPVPSWCVRCGSYSRKCYVLKWRGNPLSPTQTQRKNSRWR